MNKIKAGKGKTPTKVMGSQGNSATIPTSHYVAKPTKTTKFPE